MSDLRTAAQQALECLKGVARGKYDGNAADVCAALEAALAQQKDPTDPGNDVDVLREHVRHLERRVRQLHAQQAEPQGCATEEDCTKQPWCRIRGECQRKQAEPVEQLAELQAMLRAEVDRLIAAGIQPQRKPLPKHDQHCVDVPGYGLMAVRLVRAVERAHGIKE